MHRWIQMEGLSEWNMDGFNMIQSCDLVQHADALKFYVMWLILWRISEKPTFCCMLWLVTTSIQDTIEACCGFQSLCISRGKDHSSWWWRDARLRTSPIPFHCCQADPRDKRSGGWGWLGPLQEQWELLPSGFLQHRPTGMCVPVSAGLSWARDIDETWWKCIIASRLCIHLIYRNLRGFPFQQQWAGFKLFPWNLTFWKNSLHAS